MSPAETIGMTFALVVVVAFVLGMLALLAWQSWAGLRGDDLAAARPWGPQRVSWPPAGDAAASLPSTGLSEAERELVQALAERMRARLYVGGTIVFEGQEATIAEYKPEPGNAAAWKLPPSESEPS